MMRGMQLWLRLMLLAAVACTAGDDTADGTRAQCAEGGALNQCPAYPATAQGACWRLVDCGAAKLHRDNPDQFDWDRCVEDIQGMLSPQQELVIACIEASTCDQLKADRDPCFNLGDN